MVDSAGRTMARDDGEMVPCSNQFPAPPIYEVLRSGGTELKAQRRKKEITESEEERSHRSAQRQ